MQNFITDSLKINSPLGYLYLQASGSDLVSCRWSDKQQNNGLGSDLLQRAKQELEAYFASKRYTFSISLAPKGTLFQKKVWRALCSIGYGQTQSYQTIANMISAPRAARAVGLANGKNPLPIFIPCHRIIRASGELGGFAGGLDKKRYLLDLEHKVLVNYQNMRQADCELS